SIVNHLREGGVQAEFDTVGRGLKAQMKYANKIGARYTVVVGENELQTGKARLKNMETGQEEEILLDESLYVNLYNKSIDRQLADMAELLQSDIEG
ncbi:MAG TPA: His/Gly/Thr/Pro-type tRNA ligase C-terminal domain-containing protein, partial [Candidatus Avimonas sp.]|nr:His/Gly/Thr/Pro-type tRNA ligase C-terminal domain-containing protein [Candidatus Avimonas sp.]